MPEQRTSIADEYAHGVASMRTLHDGATLREAADAVRAALPAGPACLLSTSLEGTALAAVAAALRHDEQTCWERVTFSRPCLVPDGHRAVVVELEDGGWGWRRALEDRYPGVLFVVDPLGSRLALSA